jgi:FtsH-binding integral membrane protein
MNRIEPREAASALSDIDAIARRVRQSVVYKLASLMLVLWGVLTFAGYVASYSVPRWAQWIWIAVYVAGIGGSLMIGSFERRRSGIR